MDPELGQQKPEPGHGWQNSNEPPLEFAAMLKPGTDPVSKGTGLTFPSHPRCLAEPVGMDELKSLIRDKLACITEYRAELERLMSSIDAHQEQSSAHHQTRRRMVYQVRLLGTLYLLFMNTLNLANHSGFIDIRPWSTGTFILAAGTGLFIFLILQRMWKCYEHDQRRPQLDEFPFKFDFERMPTLKELSGEQKWKEMQECSDSSSIIEELKAIISSACDDLFSKVPDQNCGVKNDGSFIVGCP